MMWGPGWWWAGAVFMVICMVLMGRMMTHRDRDHGGTDAPERTLANRLARGEIDIDEYELRLEALRRTESPAGDIGRRAVSSDGNSQAAARPAK